MDALIDKDGVKTTLSSIGILVTDFEDSAPTLKVNRKEVTNRSGYIFTGATHQVKKMTVTGRFLVPNTLALEEKKDEINGLISNDEPFYITKMLPTSDDLYRFELPGQATDLDLLAIPHVPYKYRYKVIVSGEIDYKFLGKTSAGLLMSLSINFETAELPFGETVPRNIVATTSISYAGTAKCSQLEWPWMVRLTANASQSGAISLMIGDRTFIYQAVTPLASGDVLLLKGIETTLNSFNVNDKTNFEHFILKPSASKSIQVSTNFKGTIELLNFVELYR